MAYHKKYRHIQRELKKILASRSDDDKNLENDSSDNQVCHHNDRTDPTFMHSQHHSERSDLTLSLSVASSEESSTDNDSLNVPGDGYFTDISLQEELCVWASQNNVTRQALISLLDLLRKVGHDLPKDARTVLQTPRSVVTVEKCGGKYSYFGLASCLERTLSDNRDFIRENEAIRLIVNVDGIPLFKSSNDQFWPYL